MGKQQQRQRRNKHLRFLDIWYSESLPAGAVPFVRHRPDRSVIFVPRGLGSEELGAALTELSLLRAYVKNHTGLTRFTARKSENVDFVRVYDPEARRHLALHRLSLKAL